LPPAQRKARNGEVVNPKPYKETESANYGEFFHPTPIVAIVIAILTVVVGAISICAFAIAQFPNIAPPEIWLQANYPGADAKTLEQSVATPIEQQVTGVDNMEYMYSVNTTNGSQTS